jgi:hypothetical protein
MEKTNVNQDELILQQQRQIEKDVMTGWLFFLVYLIAKNITPSPSIII